LKDVYGRRGGWRKGKKGLGMVDLVSQISGISFAGHLFMIKKLLLHFLKASGKQWITLGFTLLMLVKAWVIPLVYLDYELRKEYIIANLCVNRDNPIAVCEGKCYLAEKIVEAKKQDERRAEQTFMANLLFQAMDTGKPFIFKSPENFEGRLMVTFDYISPFLSRTVTADIFHPPLA